MPLIARRLLATGLGMVTAFVAYLALIVTGAGGGRFGALVAAVALGAPTAAVVGAVWRPREQWRTAVAVVLVLATLGGVLVAQGTPASHGRLNAELDALVLPPMRLVDSHENGNSLCLDACPEVTRLYFTALSAPELESSLAAAAARAGYPGIFRDQRTFDSIPRLVRELWVDRAKRSLRISIDPVQLMTSVGEQGRPRSLPVPRGSVGVRVSLSSR